MTKGCTDYYLLASPSGFIHLSSLCHIEAEYEWAERFHCSLWQKKTGFYYHIFSLSPSSRCQLVFFPALWTGAWTSTSDMLTFFSHSSRSLSIRVIHCKLQLFSKVHIKVVWSRNTHLFLSLSFHTVSTYPAPLLSSCTARATCAPVWRSTSTSPSTTWQRSTLLWLSRRPAPSKVGVQIHLAALNSHQWILGPVRKHQAYLTSSCWVHCGVTFCPMFSKNLISIPVAG